MARKGRGIKNLKPSIPYFIVEGCTEENYINLLKKLYRKSAKPENTNGGNARGVLIKAKKTIKNNPEYSNFIVWFDSDRLYKEDEKLLNEVKKLTHDKVVISYPSIEGFLLAHFQKLNENQLHNNCEFFVNQLSKNHIPNYSKNDCELLESFIKDENIKNLKNNCVRYVNNFDKILENFVKM